MNLDYKHVVLGSFLYVSLGVFFVETIQGLAITNPQIPWYIGLIVNLFIYSILPLCIYIAVFTKFNNPFKKTNERQFPNEVKQE